MNRKTLIKAITTLNAFGSAIKDVDAFNIFCKAYKDRVEFFSGGISGYCKVTVETETGVRRPTKMFTLDRTGIRDVLQACRVLRTENVKFEVNYDSSGDYAVRIGSFVWSEPITPYGTLQFGSHFDEGKYKNLFKITSPERIEAMKHTVNAMRVLNACKMTLNIKNNVLTSGAVENRAQCVYSCEVTNGKELDTIEKNLVSFQKIFKYAVLSTGLEFKIDKTNNRMLISTQENNIRIECSV